MKEKLFINGGKKAREKDFEYIAPIGEEELNAVIDVVKSKRLSGFYKNFLGGDKVQEFERDFAKYIGVKHAVAFNSGTSALHAALAAIGIGPGDEVIVPPFTFTATASAVLMNNAIPVFADIDSKSLCINPDEIGDKITDKTKAIIPVHIYGKVVAMDEIMKIAAEHNLFVIEDACQAPGVEYKGKKVGSMGNLGCFSLVETKNIVAGEGGVITTDDDELAQRCRLVRNHGEVWMKGKPREYLSNILGYNFRMTEVHAAIAIEQLKKLDKFNDVRVKNAQYLYNELNKIDGLEVIKFNEGEVCHILPVLFDENKVGLSKKRFMELMASEGVPLVPSFTHALYRNPIFLEKIAYGKVGCPYSCPFYGKEIDYTNLKCEVTEYMCNNLIWVRFIHYPYTIKDMDHIVKAFKKILNSAREAEDD